MGKKKVKSESTEANEVPVKRGRGRLKGSTKAKKLKGAAKPKIQLENAVPEGTKAVTKNTSSK